LKKRSVNEEKLQKKESQKYSALNFFLAKIRSKVASYLNLENILGLYQIDIENPAYSESSTNDEEFSRIAEEEEEEFEFVEPMVFDLVSTSTIPTLFLTLAEPS
jgi:hypothetical protein